jgi:hypothetical protein
MSDNTRLADRLGQFPEAWMPEPDDLLIGTFTDVDEREGEYGDYPLVCMLADDQSSGSKQTVPGTEYAVHGFHTVLRREFAKQKPAIGDHGGIAYFGKKQGRNGTEYESYRVIIDERANPAAADTSPDWDKHAADADTELEAEKRDSALKARLDAKRDAELPPLPSDEEPF